MWECNSGILCVCVCVGNFHYICSSNWNILQWTYKNVRLNQHNEMTASKKHDRPKINNPQWLRDLNFSQSNRKIASDVEQKKTRCISLSIYI